MPTVWYGDNRKMAIFFTFMVLVSKGTLGHKSMGCQKSEDVVGLVEGRGTLRLTAEAIL